MKLLSFAAVGMAAFLSQAALIDNDSGQEVSLSFVAPVSWPMAQLSSAPKTFDAEGLETNDVKVTFLEGLPYHGRATRIFCYYGVPKRGPGEKVPGMVLVHGGAGSTFYRWVRFWNDRGYAAISMDTCGCVSGNTIGHEQHGHPRHASGGPAGWGGFKHLDEKVEDQWMYHAVGAVIRAHSFLRSLEGVDSGRIGLTGVSWGGVISCLVAAQDDRFRFVAPVYGCGDFLENSPMWRDDVRSLGPEKLARWKALWDPIGYLDRIRMPVRWLAGTNDRAFSLPALIASFDRVPGEKGLAIKVRLPHTHGEVSENALELTTWADHYLRDRPLPQPVRAELVFTRDAAEPWIGRVWQTVPAVLKDGRPVAEIPVGTTAFYFNTYSADGFVDSIGWCRAIPPVPGTKTAEVGWSEEKR